MTDNTSALESREPACIRRVQPKYEHRFSVEDIRAQTTAEEAYAKGDYVFAAEFAAERSELQGCALVFAGFIEAGVEILRESPDLSNEGRIALAFGLWSLDCNAEAAEKLRSIPRGAPEYLRAQQLGSLLDRKEIVVFMVAAHIPKYADALDDIKQPRYRRGQFEIKHVGSQLEKNAYEYELTDPFDQFIASLPVNEKPDLIFLATPQWFLPKNFELVTVPKVVWLHDSDFFMYRCYENYFKFDVCVVATSQEHFEMSRAFTGRFVSNLFSDTLLRMPEVEEEVSVDRPVDILFTGSAIQTVNSEKSRFMFLLSRLSPEFNIRIVDGHMDEASYFDLVSKSKFLPIVNRYCGQPSPRWRDAISRHAFVLYPEGVPYDKLGPGFFSFRHHSLESDLRTHLRACAAQWPDRSYHVPTVSSELQKSFPKRTDSHGMQFERTLKFCAFMGMSAAIDRAGNPLPTRRHRWVWPVPPIDRSLYGMKNVVTRIGNLIQAIDVERLEDPIEFNDLAALHIQLVNIFPDILDKERDRTFDQALEVLERGLEKNPQSLLLLFNRAHWKLMLASSADAEPDRHFEDIIARFDQLEFNPLGSDVGLGYSGLNVDPVFPYYDYGQMLVSLAAGCCSRGRLSTEMVERARRTLCSAAHGYLGLIAARKRQWGLALERMTLALSLAPDNFLLARLKIQALLELVPADPSLRPELIKLFFDCADHSPDILLTAECVSTMEVLCEWGNTAQLKALLDDWYSLGRIVEQARLSHYPDEEIDLMRPIFKYEPYFPSALAEKLSKWRKGTEIPRRRQEFDARLYIAMRSRRPIATVLRACRRTYRFAARKSHVLVLHAVNIGSALHRTMLNEGPMMTVRKSARVIFRLLSS